MPSEARRRGSVCNATPRQIRIYLTENSHRGRFVLVILSDGRAAPLFSLCAGSPPHAWGKHPSRLESHRGRFLLTPSQSSKNCLHVIWKSQSEPSQMTPDPRQGPFRNSERYSEGQADRAQACHQSGPARRFHQALSRICKRSHESVRARADLRHFQTNSV